MDASSTSAPPATVPGAATAPRSLPVSIAAAVGAVTLETAVVWFLLGRERTTDVVMVYLLGVVVVAMRFGHVASLLTAMLGVAAYDFFFTTPYFSFAIDNVHSLFTCGVMLFVAVVISNLTERTRRLAARAERLAVGTETEARIGK